MEKKQDTRPVKLSPPLIETMITTYKNHRFRQLPFFPYSFGFLLQTLETKLSYQLLMISISMLSFTDG